MALAPSVLIDLRGVAKRQAGAVGIPANNCKELLWDVFPKTQATVTEYAIWADGIAFRGLLTVTTQDRDCGIKERQREIQTRMEPNDLQRSGIFQSPNELRTTPTAPYCLICAGLKYKEARGE